MPAILAALTAAFFFSVTNYMSRIGLERATPGAAVLVSAWVNFLTFWTIFFAIMSPRLLLSPAVFPFLAAGVVGPFFGRLTLYTAMRRMGSSLAVPLHNSQAIFAAFGGMLFFNERVSSLGWLGIAILLVGLTALSLDSSAGNISGPRRKTDLLIPLASGLGFAAAFIFRKVGLGIEPQIFLGLPVVATATLISTYVSMPITGERPGFPRGTVLIPLVLTGVFSGTAQLFSLWAVNLGDLSVVIPLQNTSPVFTMIIVGVFLRRLERVTALSVLGMLLVMVGGGFLTI
ncbi:MAG: Permease of the drug/metabolite transporter (DMT) superfamily [Chloroflexi bacterium]|jgi:uncharacterized membrane protein|nr:MAG: Permease of the drug/metabolite transporter (DMT) superfamily [Chloroflexota bacterium]